MSYVKTNIYPYVPSYTQGDEAAFIPGWGQDPQAAGAALVAVGSDPEEVATESYMDKPWVKPVLYVGLGVIIGKVLL